MSCLQGVAHPEVAIHHDRPAPLRDPKDMSQMAECVDGQAEVTGRSLGHEQGLLGPHQIASRDLKGVKGMPR